MKSKRSLFIYLLCVNIPVCLSLCLAASIVGSAGITDGVLCINFKAINWLNFLYNFLVGITIAMCVGMFIPLSKIAMKFTGLFKVRNDTYKGNMPYRLLGTLIISFIYYIFISPSLTIFNYLIGVYDSPTKALLSFAINIPVMLLIGYFMSLVNDIWAYQVAIKVQNLIDKKN